MNDSLNRVGRKDCNYVCMPDYFSFLITSVLLTCSNLSFADSSAPDSVSVVKQVDVRIYETPPSRIDPAIYGAESLTPKPELEAALQSNHDTKYVAPEKAPIAEAFKGSPLLAEGKATLEANRREKATMIESVRAALSQSLLSKAFDNAPQFDWEEGYSAIPLLKQVDFPLNLEQERFLIETGSSAEFQYKLRKVMEQNMAHESMRDNPIASLITTALASGYVLFGLIPILGIWAFSRKRSQPFGNTSEHQKIFYVRWGLRFAILVAAFAIHWAFGLFMVFGLYTYLTSVRR